MSMKNIRAFDIIGAAAVFAAALVPTSHCATMEHTTLIPHKGESGEAPENTMASFRLAVDRGFGFECDIALSKDGRVFTFHDRDFARATDGAVTNKCGELTWDEISRIDIGGYGRWKGSKYAGAHPALLEEVLELARDGRMIYVDTGGPEIVPYVRDVFANQRRATPANTLFLSSNKETCRALKLELPGFKVLWVSSSRHWETQGFPCVSADEMIAAIREVGADGVDCHFDPETVSAETVAAVHEAGFEFHVWTVDNVKDAETAFRNGVDTLTTNYAEKLLRAAQASKEKP